MPGFQSLANSMAKVNPSHKFVLWEEVGQAETGWTRDSPEAYLQLLCVVGARE